MQMSPRIVAGFAFIRNVSILGTYFLIAVSVGALRGADTTGATSRQPESSGKAGHSVPMLKQYCFQCHGNKASIAGVNLEELLADGPLGENFAKWEKVASVLREQRMPPKGMPAPTSDQRAKAVSWIGSEIDSYIRKHDGDPGHVTVRRLTSGEYAYAIQDLTGLDLNTGIDSASDSVGGEGFANFGDVQFMQDANLQRYLEAAKLVANHAVIGAGPLEFFTDPGKTGFELSAISRIRDIYAQYGFRTVSGEGGRPFGLEKYGKAFYAAWRYKHRAALGEKTVSLKELAGREGITTRFAEHIWSVMNTPSLGYPSSEMAGRWRKLPAPGADPEKTARTVRATCDDIQQFLVTWPSWLFARGDLAAGGAGDESPLEFSDRTLKASAKHRFTFVRAGRIGGGRISPPPPGPVTVYFNLTPVHPDASANHVVIWRNPTVGIRPFRGRQAPPSATDAAKPDAAKPDATAAAKPAGTDPVKPAAQVATAQPVPRRGGVAPGPRTPLRELVSAETAKKLKFGISSDGTRMSPNDFASESSFSFEVPMPSEGAFTFDLVVEAELGRERDAVLRVMISDRADGSTPRGRPTWALLGDPSGPAYKKFRDGVAEFANLLPPNSHAEPTPADKDPIPEPFDNTYNVPEHDEFVVKVKYIRDDDFVVANMVDKPQRQRLDDAWNDLFASFEYHDNYLRQLAKKFEVDLKGRGIQAFDAAQIATLPQEMRQYTVPLRKHYEEVIRTQQMARSARVEDCLNFASRAWRRPLTDQEKRSLRGFYDKVLVAEGDHRQAIRAVLARVLVSPAFLYRVEQAPSASIRQPLSGWEMASRLSFFLWSSIPDQELRRAAAAGELSQAAGLRRQVKRMLTDAKARRFSTEFFGQWLGFYHFDDHRGVDTSRFPEFTDDVKEAMYDEAVSFFEHVIRKDRPVNDLLFADYTFLNKALAKHYGITQEIKSEDAVELMEGANGFQRGGLLRLGAVLTTTSAPLRTSPVKRGDWLLRRILGTPVPPPPADAGSLPADDKQFGGMSVKQRLEAHKRNPTCANCHVRIDPLGFSLERYDSIGRLRTEYSDGKPIDDGGTLADQTEIAGVDGLLDYLKANDTQVRRTLSYKLLGYALGRTISASDQPLINRMVAAGPNASFSQLITEIVVSSQFRNRAGSKAEAETTAVASANSKREIAQ